MKRRSAFEAAPQLSKYKNLTASPSTVHRSAIPTLSAVQFPHVMSSPVKATKVVGTSLSLHGRPESTPGKAKTSISAVSKHDSPSTIRPCVSTALSATSNVERLPTYGPRYQQSITVKAVSASLAATPLAVAKHVSPQTSMKPTVSTGQLKQKPQQTLTLVGAPNASTVAVAKHLQTRSGEVFDDGVVVTSRLIPREALVSDGRLIHIDSVSKFGLNALPHRELSSKVKTLGMAGVELLKQCTQRTLPRILES